MIPIALIIIRRPNENGPLPPYGSRIITIYSGVPSHEATLSPSLTWPAHLNNYHNLILQIKTSAMLGAAASSGCPTWTDIQTRPELDGIATYISNFEMAIVWMGLCELVCDWNVWIWGQLRLCMGNGFSTCIVWSMDQDWHLAMVFFYMWYWNLEFATWENKCYKNQIFSVLILIWWIRCSRF